MSDNFPFNDAKMLKTRLELAVKEASIDGHTTTSIAAMYNVPVPMAYRVLNAIYKAGAKDNEGREFCKSDATGNNSKSLCAWFFT